MKGEPLGFLFKRDESYLGFIALRSIWPLECNITEYVLRVYPDEEAIVTIYKWLYFPLTFWDQAVAEQAYANGYWNIDKSSAEALQTASQKVEAFSVYDYH